MYFLVVVEVVVEVVVVIVAYALLLLLFLVSLSSLLWNILDVFLMIWSIKPPRAARGTRKMPQQTQLLTLDDSPGEVKGSFVGWAGSTTFFGLLDTGVDIRKFSLYKNEKEGKRK